MWRALQNCNNEHVKKILTYHSKTEPNKEKKAGPEQEATMACEKCGKIFPNKANLAHHEWAAHGKTTGVRQLILPISASEEYKCFICKNIFKQKRSAQNNVQNTCTKGKNAAEIDEILKAFKFQQMFVT